MAAEKKVNYSDEMVATITRMYEELGNAGLETIAEAVNRPIKSVRAKLVNLRVYQASEKPAKVARDDGPTKKELVARIGELTGFNADTLDGLMPANKDALNRIIAFVMSVQTTDEEEAA